MGETKPVTAISLAKGNYVVLEGVASIVSNTQTSRPGKHGHAKVRLEAVGIMDGKKRQIVVPGHDDLDQPIIEKKTAQVLSVTGDSANVMDSESFETFDIKIPEELKDQVTANCNILYWEVLNDRLMKQVKSE